MRYFALFVMVLSLGMFAFGCGGDEAGNGNGETPPAESTE